MNSSRDSLVRVILFMNTALLRHVPSDVLYVVREFLFQRFYSLYAARAFWCQLMLNRGEFPKRTFFEFDGGLHSFAENCFLILNTTLKEDPVNGFGFNMHLCHSCLEPVYFHWHYRGASKQMYYFINESTIMAGGCCPDWFNQCKHCEDDYIWELYRADCEYRKGDAEENGMVYEEISHQKYYDDGEWCYDYNYDQFLTNITDEKFDKMQAFIEDVYPNLEDVS